MQDSSLIGGGETRPPGSLLQRAWMCAEVNGNEEEPAEWLSLGTTASYGDPFSLKDISGTKGAGRHQEPLLGWKWERLSWETTPVANPNTQRNWSLCILKLLLSLWGLRCTVWLLEGVYKEPG
ncbi:unnamed protein product [Lepidochelys kempii]